MLLAPGTRLGRYEIVAPLGKGGMGEVYRARDPSLGRDVAIKVLTEQLSHDPQALHRFEREARAVAALSHPNILAVYDIGAEGGTSFAVTELLEGETLRSRLATSPPNRARAIEIGVALAEGIAAAHSKGITHRDLKPENIFLTSDGRVKILDFGLARWRAATPEELEAASTETDAGRIMGSIGYMSPEQVRGERVEAPSDIFSLGCVLYETITGRRAFRRSTPGDTLAATLKEDPPPAGDPAVDRVLTHCLEKNAGERFQSARDVAFALRALGAPAGGRLPARAAAAGLAALLLVALGVWLYPRFAPRDAVDSLAVLPFVNVGGDPNLEYLSDGVTETIINTFSRLPRLRVVPRTKAFRYRGWESDPAKAGRELGVRAVLTGRVAVRGDTLNVQAELVDVEADSQLWGEQYNRKLAEILAVQDEITRSISAKLRLNPSGEEQRKLARRNTQNTEAYQLYLKGRYYWERRTEASLKRAAGYFQQALEKDPGYALAYGGLAETYAIFGIYSVASPAESGPRAKAAALEALKLDDTIAEAHSALGYVHMGFDWDMTAAEREYRRSIELNPSHPTAQFWYGLFLTAHRRFDQAISQFRHAQELAPLSGIISSYLGWGMLCAGQTDQAVDQFRKTLDIDPNFSNARLFLGQAYEQQGKFTEAIAEMEKARELSDDTLLMIASLGHAYGRAGRRRDAEKILAELTRAAGERYVNAYDIAAVYAGLRDKERTLDWLDKAYQEHSAWLVYVNADRRFEWLRPEPRFGDLLRRIHLAP
jgi:TolB-like protein/Flp pilus assembly protein TadD